MSAPHSGVTRRQSRETSAYLLHESFELPGAEECHDPVGALAHSHVGSYMPDEVTRDTARRMHYAAFRADSAKHPRTARRWRQAYFDLRDRIVLGNRKLVYKAIRTRMGMHNRADELIGDCDIVLIQAVAAFNPWLGIRFSTYAYTCLVRALSRMGQRLASDRLARSVPLEVLPNGGPTSHDEIELHSSSSHRLDEFFRADHTLLSEREKIVLTRRFRTGEEESRRTLEEVGQELGLSKERVRQLQAGAIGKLREALTH